jgi:hypothetical protein
MIVSHLSALLLTFLLYAFLAVAYLGWGRILTSLLGLRHQEACLPSYLIWMGWAFTLLLFQLVHFVLPLTAPVVIPVLIAGVASARLDIVRAVRTYSPPRSLLLPTLLGMVVVLFVGWIASRSMLTPSAYDAGLYHLSKIRWINSYPIVPGLGNLHGRLAFNQSFFAYVAALNLHPFFGHGRSIANSFLFLLTLGTFLDSLRPVFKQPSLLLEAHPFRYLFIVLLAPTLGYLALYSSGLASPTPDLTATLLQLTIMVLLAQALGEWNSGFTDQKVRTLVLGILAATAITVKLSNLVFSAVILAFVILYAIKSNARQVLLRISAFSALMFLIWWVYGLLLSGAPLYPSTVGYLPLEWAIPKEQAIEEGRWIYSWARHPELHWSIVLGSWNWFLPWLCRLFIINWIVLPAILSLLLCAIALAFSIARRANGIRPSEWSILLPSTLAIIYWFFVAPDLRFAHALFFISSMSATALFVLALQHTLSRRRLLIASCAGFLVANLPILTYLVTEGVPIADISLAGWKPITTVPLDVKITESGLPVYTPGMGDQTWDSPLPSTPYFNPALRLRDPAHIASGFTLRSKDGSWTAALNAAPPESEP